MGEIKGNSQEVKGQDIKVCVISLGCARNQVDSETMAYLIDQKGWKFTELSSTADVIIINTCAFIESAKVESIDKILQALSVKELTGCMVVVCGCFAQRYAHEVEKDFEGVDLFVGVEQYPRIVQLIEDRLSEIRGVDQKDQKDQNHPKPERIFIDRCSNLYEKPLKKINTLSFYSSYLKIADGCQHRCSFCAIPMIRGTLKSVPKSYLIQEARSLVDSGVVEINLIAQDLAAYGKDFKNVATLSLEDKKANLYNLIEDLSLIDGLRWIRLLYYYPEYINQDLIDCFNRYPNLTRYLDIPVQHASDKVLKRMNRAISFSKLKQTLSDLKQKVDGISLRTSILVGFPGETDEDVDILCDFVGEGWFDHLGCFAYSREEGTPAYNFPDQIDENEKLRRVQRVMLVQKEVSRKKLKSYVGNTLEVLVEEKDPSINKDGSIGFWGRTCFQAPGVDGRVYIKVDSDTGRDVGLGSMVKVKITGSKEYDLLSNIVE